MSHENRLQAFGGCVDWGDHASGAEPMNYLEIEDLLLRAEEVIRLLIGCQMDESTETSLIHYRCGCSEAQPGPQPGPIPKTFRWDPRADRWVLQLYTLRFDRDRFLRLLLWIEGQEAWHPDSFRPLDITYHERAQFEELKRASERMASSAPGQMREEDRIPVPRVLRV